MGRVYISGGVHLIHGDDHTEDSDGETGDEATDDEHWDVDSGSLESTS